ncbi:MAG: AmmeMemoRadiSam system protein B [Planctomycetota bacterium]|nr:AmmeMemoRadiSam system protein B [Planctomycetota bacterium]
MTQMPAQPAFDPNAPHQQRPRLRQVRAFPAQTQEGQPMLGLTDARQISDKIVYCSPAVQHVLPLMDGQHDLDAIVKQIGRGLTRPLLENLVAQLESAFLLEGPAFDALLQKTRAEFDSSATLPPAASAAFAEALVQQGVQQQNEPMPASPEETAARGAEKMRGVFNQWITTVVKDAPAFTALPRAVVAPHLDYGRGWMNYAATWGRLKGTPRPARVVILGTNHFGFATGVCGCDKGYETPLGVCHADLDLIAALRRRLGEEQSRRLFEHRFDHEREHSIELQIPWIQHVFGADDKGEFPKVMGVLVHDPTALEGKSYDGKGVDLDAFIEAIRAAISEVSGPTLVVSSADLSHCGPAFGDQQKLGGEDKPAVDFRTRVLSHDREMLGFLTSNKPDELLASMTWQQNPTRWCSIGNLVAAHRITQPAKVELLNYAGAMDPEGFTFVSSASMVMT